ncbi:hypothetical protein V6N13_037571 [Hibiscus sabdariffa]
MEPRISGHKAESVISSLGFLNSHRVEAIGFFGGIWIAWYDIVKVDILWNHFQFIHYRVTAKDDGCSIFTTTIYACPNAMQCKLLWHHLRMLAESIQSLWILFGDFNATLSPSECLGCASTSKPSKAFQDLIFDHGLRDTGYQGPNFTWSRGNASVRLDRFICNSFWDVSFLKPTLNTYYASDPTIAPYSFE